MANGRFEPATEMFYSCRSQAWSRDNPSCGQAESPLFSPEKRRRSFFLISSKINMTSPLVKAVNPHGARPTRRWENDIEEWLETSTSQAGRLTSDRETFRRRVQEATSRNG
ncbi:hypothetical protein PoB_004923600 [Plakobranchus ocellatus]|uniref:Uncharacterized protein n=1 Tax=Plakobranchus ocellatus TaxID=259542 RepID=A0AAV4BQJ1_9GAST|nr:hypothetical protein PoB_004923600 [Plakobranchus ocellatus]